MNNFKDFLEASSSQKSVKLFLNLTDFIFRQQENLVDNQKCQAGFRPLCNKILLILSRAAFSEGIMVIVISPDYWTKLLSANLSKVHGQ